MNKLNFESCKREIDSIKLSQEQKNELIAVLSKADVNSKVVEFSDVKKPKFPYKKLIAVASLLVLLFTSVFLVNNSSKEENLKDFKMTVSLSDKENDDYVISNKATIFAHDDNVISVGKGDIKLSLLDFHIEGAEIESVDISSQNNNYISCTYREKSGDMNTEINRTNYTKLPLDEVSYIGWMPSYENLLIAEDMLREDNHSDVYDKYLSDVIDVTAYMKNGESFKKEILVSYDSQQNYVIRYRE